MKLKKSYLMAGIAILPGWRMESSMKGNCYRRSALFSMAVALPLCLALIFLATPAVNADTYAASETSSYFGSLAQPYPFGTASNPNPYVCAQTSSVNSFVYLQNAYPDIYGTSLVAGTDFNSMNSVATTLNNNYITTTWSGSDATVKYSNFASGTYNYVLNQGKEGSTYFYQEFSGSSPWITSPPNHASAVNENPTWSFLYNGLKNGDTVDIAWKSASGQGHYMVLTAMQFNTGTGFATISYVDPKDGVQYKAPIYLNQDGTIGFLYSNTTHPWYTGNVGINMALVFGPNQLSSMDLQGAPSLPQAGWIYSNSIGARNSIKITDMSGSLSSPVEPLPLQPGIQRQCDPPGNDCHPTDTVQ